MKHILEQKNLADDFYVESSGIGDWHIGESPDSRMAKAAQKRGITLKNRAKQFKISNFDEYDYIFASCHDVKDYLKRQSTNPLHHQKLFMMTHFSKTYPQIEVPDPYYGSEQGFDHVLDILEESCYSLLNSIYKDL